LVLYYLLAHDVNKIAGLPADLDFGDLFTMDLKYDAPAPANSPTNTTVAPEYGGNISQMTWQTRGREKQSYTFKYDYINRMTEADLAGAPYVNCK